MPGIIDKKLLCRLLVVAIAFSSLAAFAKDGEKQIAIQQDVAKAELIKLSLPAGDVEIIGTTGNTLQQKQRRLVGIKIGKLAINYSSSWIGINKLAASLSSH